MANKKKKTITDILNEATGGQTNNKSKDIAPINLGNAAKSVTNTIQSATQKTANKTQNIPISPTVSTNDVTKSILGVQQNTQNKMFNDITNKTIQTVQAPIMTPQQIKSPENIAKQQENIKKGQEKARQEGGNKSLEGTALNSLKLFGQGMMKAEEGAFIDFPTALLSMSSNVSSKLLSGMTKPLEKLGILESGYSQQILQSGEALQDKLNRFAGKDLTSNALDYYGWNKKLNNGKTVTETLEDSSAVKQDNIAGQVIEGLGGMAPSILLGGIVGGGQAVSPQDIEKVQKAQNLISYSSLGARSYGNAYEEAIQNGATTEQASAYGLSSAAVEIGTEWLSGGIPGIKGTAGGGLDSAFEKYILKEGLEETSKSLSKAIVKSLYKTSMEGVEEMISQTLEPYIKQFTYQYDKSKGFKGNLEEATNKVNLEDIIKAGIVGSLTAVALGDANITDMKAGYQTTQAINNTITDEIEAQQNVLGRELTKEESNAIKTQIKDYANDLNKYGEEIANKINDVKNNNASTEGLDLEQSYKAYNGEKKYTKEITNIQKFMNNRNINARFDATMFNDNSQNAIWTTQDGKDTVVFNPKASQDQVIQNIATHEMTHDIMAQQTETGKSLFNDVLENIKSQENYAKQRAEIEDLYAKYYDRNSEDFSAKVDEEMVANELGKNLGTQEYINRLVNEKPNLARRIYNWVKDKLDNIGKSAEYKEQKVYWKSVADKFEKAYNEQKTTTGENKTAYDISYRGSHQIEDGKSITELDLDDVKNKITEIDGYLTNQSQSDLKKLQKILNNPSEKVKIYRASPVNELNNGDWVTTDRSYAQNVADNNGGKVYSYEVDANQLLYPDNVRELPSLHRLSSFQYNGENINQTKYSMQQEETPFTEGTRTTMGELFENNIAPIREDLSNITEQMNNLSNQIETLQNGLENVQQGYVETYNEQRNENIPTRNLTEEDANTLQDALMNDEGYIRSLEEQANTNNTNEKLVSNLVKDMQNRFSVTKENKPKMEALIREAIENNLTTDEIADRLGKDFSYIKDTYKNEEIKDVKKAIKEFGIKVDDTIKTDIADYVDFQKRNYGKIPFSKNGLPVDTVYQQLNARMPGYFPSNIVNTTDQLLRIAEVANTPYITTYENLLDQDYIDDAADYIRDAIDNDIYNTQMESQADLEKNIQFGFNDEILPTTIRTQESIDEYVDNRDIAPISQEQMQKNQQAPVKDRANNMIGKALQMFENRNFEIDSLAKATGNNEIKYAGDNWNNASSEANFNINNYQTDINGKWVGDSLTTIFNEMEQQGLGLVANDYLFQKSNIERHNVGKGSVVPLAVSQQLVAKYEMEHPELKKWSKKVYKLIDNYTKEQLASGLISKEKYDSYRGEFGIYGEYVPFYSAVIDKSRYFDNDGELKSVSTFKKSKGGSSDVNQLLAMKDAIANQIFRTKEAVRKNELFKEIVQQYQKYDDMLDMDMRNDPTNLDDSLFTTPDGDKVLSAYIDGKKVSAIISDELYNELSRENENRIQQMEKDFSLITKPLQKASDIRRKLVTTWNVTFLARNMIKDVQDAVINSKHTTDMLANYFGTKKGSKAAIFELAQAKTTEAQQFLALYGADNLYGDYSNVKSKFSLGKANELIELAPRFAEFKATLQNGGSINEAIYNAREVTVNFGRGGYITKALNRNGFTFLNANVQGLSKAIRNLTGQNGVKGVVGTVTKGMLFAVAPAILNHLLFGSGDDKDEEYEALPDYIKDNYYLIKLENGKFLRIPKGRINSVFGSGARRMLEFAGGDKEAFDGYLTNAWSQIGIGDLTSNNVFAPILQAKNNETWYGGDLVPKRLQDLPEGEQTDASIDALSNFIGENLGISPYKVNYVLDQYTGGFGDILLPMITPETTSGAETPLEYLTAPIKDAFVVNSIDDNKYAGEFYTKKEELTKKGNSMYATDEDKLRSKYMDSISSQMSELYKEKREVQADTTISNSYKYEKVQRIQNEINSLAKEGLSNYESFSKTDTYSQIGDTEYYKNNEGKWTKVNESDAEFTAGLTDTEKQAYYVVKNKVSELESEYKEKVKDLGKKDKLRDKYSLEKKYNTIQAIKNSGLDNQTKAMVYGKYYSTDEKMRNVANADYDIDTYMTALYDIEEIRNKYSKEKGYTTAQRKKKTLAYINSLNMNVPQKAMLVRQYYTSFRQYNSQIVNYVSNLDITKEEKVSILEDMGMQVRGNRVTWK